MSVVGHTSACPTCSKPLQPHSTKHGIIWVCDDCLGFAANLAVIRKVAPRPFVKYLWLAALESGVPSKHACPSCSQPLLDFRPEVEVSPACKLCCRCFLIWFDSAALTALGLGADQVAVGQDILGLAFEAVDRLANGPKRIADGTKDAGRVRS